MKARKSSSRRPAQALDIAIEEVKKKSKGLSFFQLVRLIYRIQASGRSEEGETPEVGELIKFSSQVTMAFPTGDIESIDWALPLPGRSRRDEDSLPEIVASVMGLAGHRGPLPDVYTRMLSAQRRQKQGAFRAFLDIFNHRLLSIFYHSWETSFPWFKRERHEEDLLTQAMAALAGLNAQESRDPLPLHGDVLLKYASSLIRRPISSDVLIRVLEDHLCHIPFELHEFVGSWVQIDDSSMSRLTSKEPTRLSGATVLGRRYWDVQGLLKVSMGPVSYEDFLTVLPEGARSLDIGQLVKLLAGSHLSVTTDVSLYKSQVPGARLGGPIDQRARLCRNAFLGAPPGEGLIAIRLGTGPGPRVRECA